MLLYSTNSAQKFQRVPLTRMQCLVQFVKEKLFNVQGKKTKTRNQIRQIGLAECVLSR